MHSFQCRQVKQDAPDCMLQMFLNENIEISTSLKYVPKGSINNILAFV